MIDAKTAKSILLQSPVEKLTETRLKGVGLYVSAIAGEDEATLDGQFTADELEAIAAWMRDPKGVAGA